MRKLHRVTHPNSVALVTYVAGDSDYAGDAWVYPGCVAYRPETITQTAGDAGFEADTLDWPHRHGQVWLLLSRDDRVEPLPTIPDAWSLARTPAEVEALRFQVAALTAERDSALTQLAGLQSHLYVRLGRSLYRLLRRPA